MEKKLLPPLFTGSEGAFPIFGRKSGISEYLLRKYSNSPRPSATPLINAGGKIGAFFTRWVQPRLYVLLSDRMIRFAY